VTLTRGHCYWRFILWPLYDSEQCLINDPDKKEELHLENRRFLLFSKVEKVKDSTGRVRSLFARIWPLALKIKKEDGFELFYFPALFPIEDEGFNRNYGAFLRLYEYVRDPRGFFRSRALWGLYRHDTGPEESFIDLAFVLNYRRHKEAWELTILKGLLGVGNAQNSYRLKLFFLKIF